METRKSLDLSSISWRTRKAGDIILPESKDWGLPKGLSGKESACSAGDPGSIPGLERSPGQGNCNPVHILAWRIPWTEEPGGLQSMGSQRVRHE